MFFNTNVEWNTKGVWLRIMIIKLYENVQQWYKF